MCLHKYTSFKYSQQINELLVSLLLYFSFFLLFTQQIKEYNMSYGQFEQALFNFIVK